MTADELTAECVCVSLMSIMDAYEYVNANKPSHCVWVCVCVCVLCEWVSCVSGCVVLCMCDVGVGGGLS